MGIRTGSYTGPFPDSPLSDSLSQVALDLRVCWTLLDIDRHK